MDIYLMGVDISWRRKDREVGVDIYLLGVDLLWRRTDLDLDAMTVTTMRARGSEYVMVCQSILHRKRFLICLGLLPQVYTRERTVITTMIHMDSLELTA